MKPQNNGNGEKTIGKPIGYLDSGESCEQSRRPHPLIFKKIEPGHGQGPGGHNIWQNEQAGDELFIANVGSGDQPGKATSHADSNEAGGYRYPECVEKWLVENIFAVFAGKNRFPVVGGEISCGSSLNPHQLGRVNPERVIDD